MGLEGTWPKGRQRKWRVRIQSGSRFSWSHSGERRGCSRVTSPNGVGLSPVRIRCGASHHLLTLVILAGGLTGSVSGARGQSGYDSEQVAPPRHASTAVDSGAGAQALDSLALLSLKEHLVDRIRVGADVVVITKGLDGKVTRVTPSGRALWAFPALVRSDLVGSTFEAEVGGLVVVPGGDLLEFGYCKIADHGVSVKRFNPSDGKARWEVFCEPLGVGHSMYSQVATVEVLHGQARVMSRGDFGTFVEWLDLRTGKQIRRRQTLSYRDEHGKVIVVRTTERVPRDSTGRAK